MNKLTSAILLTAALVIVGSCKDDFLEEKKNYNAFGYDIFQSEMQTNQFLAYIYYCLYNGYSSPIELMVGSFSDEKTKMTEEIGGTIASYIDSSKTLGTADEGCLYYGGRMKEANENNTYTRIRNCNMIIENMDKYGKGYLSDEFINHAKGQAYYLRGLQYFDLMRTYGGVPIVTTVQNASQDDNSIKLPRAPVEDLVWQIASDFNTASELLPSNWPNATADYGRPTKGSALAMKCRVLMTGASPLFNRDWDNTSNSTWQKALQAGLDAETELASAGFGLYGNSATDWANLFYKFNGVKCSEAINVILCGVATKNCLINEWESSIRLPSQGGSGIPAPKEMIDLFPMKDGSRPTAENGYNEFLFFKNRDPRFYHTFAFPGRKWRHNKTGSNESASTIWAYSWVNISDNDTIRSFRDENNIKSPAFVCKMSNSNIELTNLKYGGADIFEYRYAELLLNIAECYAATGQINSCLEYLGRVRARVGITADNNYGIGNPADKYAALEACLYERRIELAYEGKRFWDIQRWMLYNDDSDADNNTCEKLRIAPINGTCRTGHYLQAKATGSTDPLSTLTGSLSFDPDANNRDEQLNALANFYTDNLEIVNLDDPLDRISNKPAKINWKQNYYVLGLHTEVFTYNQWIEQTEGWTDNYGSPGTFKYR